MLGDDEPSRPQPQQPQENFNIFDDDEETGFEYGESEEVRDL
jgi:hypothetical protein